MSNERQKNWELEQQVAALGHRLNTAKTANTRLTRERDEAITARYDDQTEAISLRHQLGAKTGEVERLTQVLEATRGQMSQIAENSDQATANALGAQVQLSEAREKVVKLRSQGESDLDLMKGLAQENKSLRAELQRREDVDEENSRLRGQLRFWEGRAKLYSSQVGNFLVGTGKVPMRTWFLETLGRVPLLGRIVSAGSEGVHNHYQNKKRKDSFLT